MNSVALHEVTIRMSEETQQQPPQAPSGDTQPVSPQPEHSAASESHLESTSDEEVSSRGTVARQRMSQRIAAVDSQAQQADAAGRTADEALLALNDLQVYYGNIHALKGISLHVGRGEVVTIIGANGAGKSTTLKTISGLLKPRSGTVHYDGRRIDGVAAETLVARGIVQAPEGRRIFANLTVNENLDMGAYLRRDRNEIERDRERVFTLFPRLKERRRQRAGTMSGGEQQMLAIGRALMSKPRVLLLDEPSLGLAPVLVGQIFEVIRQLNSEEGLTILLVEQNAAVALKTAHRAYVLETGRVVMQGPAEELATNPEVQAAYLGGN